MNHSEAVAQAVVESVIPCSRMVYHAGQSQGVHDFDLYYDDGRIAAVEATESVSTAGKETDAAIVSSRKGGQRIKTKLCRKPWRIRPGTGANINRIREVVDRYLAAVESAGIDHFFSASDRHKSAAVDKVYKDLQIYSGDVMEWEPPGHITIGLPIEGGAFSGTMVHDAVMVEALKPDNRRKLASAGTSERHLVVFVDVLNHRVWTSLAYSTPPPEGTDLPKEITDVWAIGQGKSENQYIVWRARRGLAWYRLGPVTAQLRR